MEIKVMEPAQRAGAVAATVAADTLFAQAGLVLAQDAPQEMFDHAEQVLVAVADGAVLGVAATLPLDGNVHPEQLSVHPDHERRGIGSALLETVCAGAAVAGAARVTLTTFRDLPWNLPWYGARGFTVLPRREWGPGLLDLWEQEEPIRVRPRVAMVRRVG